MSYCWIYEVAIECPATIQIELFYLKIQLWAHYRDIAFTKTKKETKLRYDPKLLGTNKILILKNTIIHH